MCEESREKEVMLLFKKPGHLRVTQGTKRHESILNFWNEHEDNFGSRKMILGPLSNETYRLGFTQTR